MQSAIGIGHGVLSQSSQALQGAPAMVRSLPMAPSCAAAAVKAPARTAKQARMVTKARKRITG
jgi:hypothetical protein